MGQAQDGPLTARHGRPADLLEEILHQSQSYQSVGVRESAGGGMEDELLVSPRARLRELTSMRAISSVFTMHFVGRCGQGH